MGFLNATEAEFDALYNIHVKGVFFLTQKLVPLMVDGGRIVNISSGLTRIVMANRAPYAFMKSAVETMTKYMAFELGSRGIAVNCVAPGAIATDFSGGVVRDNPEVAKAISAMTGSVVPGSLMTLARRLPHCFLKTIAGSTPSVLKSRAVCAYEHIFDKVTGISHS